MAVRRYSTQHSDLKCPMDVVEAAGVPSKDKLSILKAWEADERALQRAEDISVIKKITGEDVTEWYPAKDAKTKGPAEWDVRQATGDGRAMPQGRLRVRARLRRQQHGREPDPGATFGAFGPHLVDAKGNITVDFVSGPRGARLRQALRPFPPAQLRLLR